tara:strand:+ start:27004 stop:27471 length:468 start_codon:yes stop_codon:yes gene_type:complete
LSSNKPETWLHLKRVVRFGDTDSAGVMHFYQLLRWCHEAWEESLEIYGLSLKKIFPQASKLDHEVSILLPIVHCEANFLGPIEVGDQLSLELSPEKIDHGGFYVKTKFRRDDVKVGIGSIYHRSIDAKTRRSCDLPEDIARWIESSFLNSGIKSI